MSNKRRKVQQHGSRLKGQLKGQLKGPGTPGLKHKVPKPGKSHGKPGQNLASKSASASAAKAPTKPKKQQQNQRPTIPFSSSDSILLVGEGDLSFARSLVEHHGCVDVTATVLEKDLDELVAKYPHAAENVKAIESSSPTPPAGYDADASSARSTKSNRVLFGVDARKMAPLPGGKQRSKQTGGGSGGGSGSGSNSSTKTGTYWDRIVFNFPHVGGKSTDVNRQVRYNQELLVDFFGSASARRCLAPGGAIVVTLFEAEPYTLWNVRDLARHSGLQVERSFAFSAGAYPGYRHARTLGVVRSAGGKGGVSSAAWRGEDRAARSYVFYRKGEVPPPPPAPKGGRKKRKRGGDDDDDDDDDDKDDGDDDKDDGDDDRGDQIRDDSLNSGDDDDDDQDDDDDDDDGDEDEDNGDPSGADSDGGDPSDN
ncbi:hypothetical protein RB594_003097 [Gaeumannomyces avenae]